MADMDEADVEVTGFLGNMCGAIQQAILGCLCVPITIMIICWNEQNAVCKAKAFADAKSKHIETNCAYSAANNDEFVHYACDVESSLQLNDPDWNVETLKGTPSWELTAKTEFYGWKESSRSETERSGGTTRTYTCYEWTLGWYTSVPDLSQSAGRAECTSGQYNNQVRPDTTSSDYTRAVAEFRKVENKAATRPIDGVNLYQMNKAQTKTTGTGTTAVTVPDTTYNGFRIPNNNIGDIDGATPVPAKITSTTCQTSQACSGYRGTLDGNQWYRSARGSSSASNQVGDIRVTFSAKGGSQISGIGVQAKDTVGTNRGILIRKDAFGGGWICGKKEVYDIEVGNMTPIKMFEKLNEELGALTWFLRAFCFFCLWGAFYCCMSPIAEAPNIIPCCGEFISDLMSCAICFVACGCGCMCWMFWTGVFFMLYNPLVGGPFVVISLCIMGYFAYTKYNKDQSKGGDEDDNETPDTEMQGTGGAPPPMQTQAPAGVELPEGWIAKLDPQSGQTYYCFEATGVTQWEVPTA